MPLLRNNYQPYFPDPYTPGAIACGLGSYCHPISLGDTIFSQFYQTPCNANLVCDDVFSDYSLGAELVTNGTFTGSAAGWTLDPGWSYNAGNFIEKAIGNSNAAYQTGLGMVAGRLYQVSYDITFGTSSFYAQLGDGAGATVGVQVFADGTYTEILLFNDTLDDDVQLFPFDDDFSGQVDNVSVREVTLTCWDTNDIWTVADGAACKLGTGTGNLVNATTDYIVSGDYYYVSFDITVNSGSLQVYIDDGAGAETDLQTAITSGGFKEYWITASQAGVIGFKPSSDFTGCISSPNVQRLRNDYSGDLVAEDGTLHDISSFFEYYEDFVTLKLILPNLEIPYGCYYLDIYDACLISGSELVFNGDFSGGSTDWSGVSYQHAIAAGVADLIFDPITGLANIVTNGDFATNDFTGWTPGANWSAATGAAVHTPGSTATLTQSIVIAAPPAPPTPEQYWVQFTVAGWTTGTIRVSWGGANSSTFAENGTILLPLNPGITGSCDLVFTPSSAFDGSIDDIGIFISNTIWVAQPTLTNTVQPLIVAGNYQLEVEITAQSDPRIAVGVMIVGQTPSITYFSTVGVHTVTINNYVPGAQAVRLIAKFTEGTNRIPGTITVDNVSAIRIEPFEATYTSECLNYRLAHENTVMVRAYCDQDAFGFEFLNTGFYLQQRAIIRGYNPVFPKTKVIQKSGTGNAEVKYATDEKYWLWTTDWVSETFHSAMTIMVDCDHLLIGTGQSNGTEYIVEVEEYTPEWRTEGDYALAPVTMRIRIKEGGQVFNRHT